VRIPLTREHFAVVVLRISHEVSNLKVPFMLGQTVRDARTKKRLTQDRLAKMAGVSRRHLAALEKGANVSINIVQRVASVLELTEIPLGEVSLRPSDRDGGNVNVPLLADTIRELRVETGRTQEILARAEGILGGDVNNGLLLEFPRMPVRRIEAPAGAAADTLRERPDFQEVTTAGEIRQGEPIDENAKETVALPRSLVEEGEIVFRARGEGMADQNIADGDLLVVELRPRGRAATGELVIGRIGKVVYIGRWWQKHGQKALLSNGLADATVGRSARSLKVVAAINQIVRGT
jgi:transcriptional regulator with XRE-family HTH domain